MPLGPGRYLRLNSAKRSGECPYHFRNSVLGATSFTHSSKGAPFLETPRGHSRPTST